MVVLAGLSSTNGVFASVPYDQCPLKIVQNVLKNLYIKISQSTVISMGKCESKQFPLQWK